MPLSTEMWPYLVFGDGIPPEGVSYLRRARYFGKKLHPIPVYYYAPTLEIAKQLAKQIETWHETVLICKVEEVVR